MAGFHRLQNRQECCRFAPPSTVGSRCALEGYYADEWTVAPGFGSGLGRAGSRRCNPADLVGPYAFQLSGSTDIGGTPNPTASLGRIAFDGRGGLSGTASATFSGLLLGNPVTGSYEAKSDCSVIWKLQDDSGGFQNFSGTFSGDGTSVQFKQTDPGGAQHGIMQKTSDACSAADLQKKYDFTASGSTHRCNPAKFRAWFPPGGRST